MLEALDRAIKGNILMAARHLPWSALNSLPTSVISFVELLEALPTGIALVSQGALRNKEELAIICIWRVKIRAIVLWIGKKINLSFQPIQRHEICDFLESMDAVFIGISKILECTFQCVRPCYRFLLLVMNVLWSWLILWCLMVAHVTHCFLLWSIYSNVVVINHLGASHLSRWLPGWALCLSHVKITSSIKLIHSFIHGAYQDWFL